MNRLALRLFLAQSIDAATFIVFVLAIPVSVHTERNPLVAAIYALGGFAAVGAVKVAVAFLVAQRSVVRPLRHPRLVTVLMSIATASGIVGSGFNVASIISSVR